MGGVALAQCVSHREPRVGKGAASYAVCVVLGRSGGALITHPTPIARAPHAAAHFSLGSNGCNAHLSLGDQRTPFLSVEASPVIIVSFPEVVHPPATGGSMATGMRSTARGEHAT